MECFSGKARRIPSVMVMISCYFKSNMEKFTFNMNLEAVIIFFLFSL